MDVALQAGVPTVVYSALAPAEKLTGGKVKLAMGDCKFVFCCPLSCGRALMG